ncbi:MAG: ABC transporter permease [Bdellovibrionota bacterium]
MKNWKPRWKTYAVLDMTGAFFKIRRKIWAFYVRDFEIAMTFRFKLLQDLLRISGLLFSFFFIGKVVGAAHDSQLLSAYGGDYFRFVLLGIAVSGFMSASLSTITRIISTERAQGTLEAILLTPTTLSSLLVGKTMWEISITAVKICCYLLFGMLILGMEIPQANPWSALPTAFLIVTTFLGLGMMSAAFNLITREASPVEMLLNWGSQFFGGVYFPVAVLPVLLQKMSAFLPLTCALEAMRKSLIHGAGCGDLKRELMVLSICTAVFLPLGLMTFKQALRKAKQQGTLGFS